MNRNKSSSKPASSAPKSESSSRGRSDHGGGRGGGRGGSGPSGGSRGGSNAPRGGSGQQNNRGGGNTGSQQGRGGRGGGRGGRGRGRGTIYLSEPRGPGFARKVDFSGEDYGDVSVQGKTAPQPQYRPNPHRAPSRLRGSGAKKTGSHDSVHLSDKNQEMIVDLLKNLDEETEATPNEAGEDGAEYDEEYYDENDDYDGEEYDENEEDYDENVAKLRKLGFRQVHAVEALNATNNKYDEAVEWLCLNLANSDLPPGFGGAKQSKLGVLVSSNDPSHENSMHFRERFRRLQPYAFPDEQIKAHLLDAAGNETIALYSLLRSLYPVDAFDFEKIPEDVRAEGEEALKEQINQQREEEMMAIESIFAPEEYTKVSSSLIRFTAKLDRVPGMCECEFHIPESGEGSSYPFHPILVAFKNQDLPNEVVLYVTSKLIDEAMAATPGPAVYSLVSFFQTSISRLVSNFDSEKARKEAAAAASARSKAKQLSQQATKAASRAGAVGGSAEKVLKEQVKEELEDAKKQSRIQFLKKVNAEEDVKPQKTEESLVDSLDAQLVESSPASRRALQNDEMTLWKREYVKKPVSQAEIEALSEKSNQLRAQFIQMQNTNKKYQAMQIQRRKLPAYEMKDQIIDAVFAHQVILISGATGCGKTTQVGQLILDEMINRCKGAECSIICTQPRRLAATGVAARVADERAEKLGGTIGYSIRLETVRSEDTRLLFVTTGVLLRRLQNDPWLEGISHLILDEVHERDLNSDFLLIILKELIKKRPALKLVLMSATLNAEIFCSYFSNCPVLEIPGRTFPVKDFYLEDAVEQSGYMLSETSPYAKGPGQKVNKAIAKNFGPSYSPRTIRVLETLDQKKINYELIERLVYYICSTYRDDGAILIFLPGLQEISAMCDALNTSGELKRVAKGLRVLPLHSSLSTEQQQQIFERPPAGVRKIVVGTNIAETSITIDDVVYVIDSCRVKEKTYDASTRMESLEEAWTSQAASRQRRGRAGRVREGMCWHLVTSARMQNMEPFQIPEMRRVPLDELCLQIRLLKLGAIRDFLSRAIEPPPGAAITQSVENLVEIGALDKQENLTPLGCHLAQLPVVAGIGKMMLFGAMFRCLSPVLTICATLSTRTPFVSSISNRDDADAVKREFDDKSRSDHMTALHAYEGWVAAKKNGREAENRFCWDHFLSKSALWTIQETRRHFKRQLKDIGFITGNHDVDNVNSSNVKLIRTIICAGLYPNVVRIDSVHDQKGAITNVRFRTKTEEVFIHPTSVNHQVKVFTTKWLIYHEKVKTTKIYLRDATMISNYALLLFGGELKIDHEKQEISVDGWMRFDAPVKVGVLMNKLRRELDRVMLAKIEDPREDISKSKVVNAIEQLISSEYIASAK